MPAPIRLDPETDALVAVDVQPTFMPGGGLAVERGDEVVPVIRGLLPRFVRGKRFATLDRHPRGHISLVSSYDRLAVMLRLTDSLVKDWSERRHRIGPMAKFGVAELRAYLDEVGEQVLWPDHAIAGTAEAELHPAFREDEFAFVQVKGTDPLCDSYSGFYDNLGRRTGLDAAVAVTGAKRLFVGGLAFDFCVGWTALDARKALPNLEVFVIEDACRSVNMPATPGGPGSVAKMARDLGAAGVEIVHSSHLA